MTTYYTCTCSYSVLVKINVQPLGPKRSVNINVNMDAVVVLMRELRRLILSGLRTERFVSPVVLKGAILIEAGNQDECQRESATPRALLSVSDNKVIRTLLQFIVTLGLYPYLLPGAGLSLRSNSPNESVTKVQSMVWERRVWYLYIVVKVLVVVTEGSPSLSSIVCSTAFSDMLSALVQTCFAPPEKPASNLSSSSSTTVCPIHTPADITPPRATPTSNSDPCLLPSDREWCMTTLQRLLDRTHQATVVRELLMLQGMPQTSKERGGRVSKRVGSPAWLQRACGRLLSQRLMKKNGVLCVLQGILGAVSGEH